LRGGDESNTFSRAFRVAGPKAFTEAGITLSDADHLMLYDAPCLRQGASFAHLPIYRGSSRRGRVIYEL
jgi:hypothetical protein